MPKAPSEFVGEYIRRTPKRVTAMRWQPGHLEAAGAMIGWLMGNGIMPSHPTGMGETTTLQLAEGILAQPGWWIVRVQLGNDVRFAAMNDETFRNTYERRFPNDPPNLSRGPRMGGPGAC